MRGVIGGTKLAALCSAGTELRVLGVFSSAVYLRSSEGVAAMLHDSSLGFISFGIAVEDFSGKGRTLGLAPESPVLLEAHRLISPDSGFELALLPRPHQYRRPTPPGGPELERLWETAHKAVEKDGRSPLLIYSDVSVPPPSADSIADPFARAGRKGVLCLGQAMKKRDAALAAQALDGLLGLGRGLTPSFDDFLCGSCYILNILRPGDAFTELFSSALSEKAGERTNQYSAAYLRTAAKGEISLLDDLLSARPGREAEAAAAALLRLGSSSGADMLCGVLFALSCR